MSSNALKHATHGSPSTCMHCACIPHCMNSMLSEASGSAHAPLASGAFADQRRSDRHPEDPISIAELPCEGLNSKRHLQGRRKCIWVWFLGVTICKALARCSALPTYLPQCTDGDLQVMTPDCNGHRVAAANLAAHHDRLRARMHGACLGDMRSIAAPAMAAPLLK
jgi:hypothetical protein